MFPKAVLHIVLLCVVLGLVAPIMPTALAVIRMGGSR